MSMRGAQRGSLSRRGGSWVVQYRRHVPGPNGVEYRATRSTIGPAVGFGAISKKAALALADKILAEANAPAAVASGLATVRQFVSGSFLPQHVASLTPSGRAHYNGMLDRHILPTLGDLELHSVRPLHIQNLIIQKSNELVLKRVAGGKTEQVRLSQQTLRHIRNVVSAVFRHAKLMGVYDRENPAGVVRVTGGRETAPQAPLSKDQLRQLIGVIAPEYRSLVVVLAATGLRIGEALGLRWDCVNLSGDTVVIEGLLVPPNCIAVVRSFGRFGWGKTKTQRSRRIVPLTKAAAVALRGMWMAWVSDPEVAPCSPLAPVFTGENGQPLDAHNIAARFLKPAGKTVGAPWVHWHTFRHTVATMAELDIAEMQKSLGHSSVQTTVGYTTPRIDKVRAGLEGILDGE